MDTEKIVAHALAIQRLPSPTFDENERAEYLRDRFHHAGLDDVQIDSTGNVLARRGEPGEPGVLVRAHLDSVFRSRGSASLVMGGMSLGNVYHTGLPARRLRISVRTPGGHSWTHAGRASATHELIRLAEPLLRFPPPPQPPP